MSTPWCWLCDRPHEPCDESDLALHCIDCESALRDDEITDDDLLLSALLCAQCRKAKQ